CAVVEDERSFFVLFAFSGGACDRDRSRVCWGGGWGAAAGVGWGAAAGVGWGGGNAMGGGGCSGAGLVEDSTSFFVVFVFLIVCFAFFVPLDELLLLVGCWISTCSGRSLPGIIAG
ncbi:MAG: hypothetical protein ACKPKO_20765, partial [Candidatus Fonsibacter sp.]